MSIEPDLQPLTGEQLSLATSNRAEGARPDVAANGFWGGRYERALFDVKVFNPYAPSYRHTPLLALYRQLKKCGYRTEGSRSRTHVVHSTRNVAGWRSEQSSQQYVQRTCQPTHSEVELKLQFGHGLVALRLMFSLLRSSIMCIHGAHSSSGHAAKPLLSVDLMTAESQVAFVH